MPDYKGMDKSQYSGNDRYMKRMKGKSAKLMKNHGNTSSIETTSAQKFDMGRMQPSSMEYKGHSNKAFEYDY